MNIFCAYKLRLDFVWWVKIRFFDLYTLAVLCELVHSQNVSCLWMNMFMCTQDWYSVKIHSFFYLIYPIASLWTGTFSGGKLPLNEHICTYSRLNLWDEWKFIRSFYLLFSLAVLWSGALLDCKLPLNEHVCAYSWLDFVWCVKIDSFYVLCQLAVLWTGALSGGKLPLNEHVCGYW